MKKNSMSNYLDIHNLILEIRDQKVLLDSDLAKLYGTTTKTLNQAVKRNINRFPQDFMFKLTPSEISQILSNYKHLNKLKFSYQTPHVFAEHGALMLASILNSETAIHVSVEIVRAFVKMRSMLIANTELVKKIDALEMKVSKHDEKLKTVFDAIRQLMSPTEINKKSPVGFQVT